MPSDLSSSELQEHADASLVPPTAERDAEDDEISLLDLLIVLAERKRIILSVTAVFAILAIIVSLILPTRYTATVTLLSPQQGTSMSAALASQLGSMGSMAALAGGSHGHRCTCSSRWALKQSTCCIVRHWSTILVNPMSVQKGKI